MNVQNLDGLLVHELRDLYSAENQLLAALPSMVAAAKHKQLAEAFREHLEETRGQVERLENAFSQLPDGGSPDGEHCEGMAGLIREARQMLDADAPDDVKDAGLISQAQRLEHYEIASYGSARAFAQQLGLDNVANLLQKTLDEAGAANERFTKIATEMVNRDAKRPV
jgi:ferritin-like metal-binding protein YciE